jgi:hypothetical protein
MGQRQNIQRRAVTSAALRIARLFDVKQSIKSIANTDANGGPLSFRKSAIVL